MKRLLALPIVLAAAAAAQAHFVFIVPDDSTSGKAKVIFSDTLKPDERVGIDKIAGTKLFVLDPSGKDAELSWTLDKGGAHYKLDVPGAGTRVVGARTDYGVLQRGDSKPFWLHYHAKAVFGDLPAPDKSTFGKRAPVELVPVAEAGKLRFLALADGKPLAKSEVSVLVPGGEKAEETTTDEKGLTPAFDKGGQYGARVRLVEAKSGAEKGKKYEEVRHYATVVLHFDPAKAAR